MLYYIAVKASIAKKNIFSSSGFLGAKFFAIILLIVLFFNLGSAKAQVTGVNVNFDEFICLFEKTDPNTGKCNSINPTEEQVKSATESGLAKGKVDFFTKEGVTPSGITALTMQIGLLIDEKREKKEINYFFSRVADDRNETFLIRIQYIKQGETKPTYKFIRVPYTKKDFSRPSADIFNITPKTSSVVAKRDGGADQIGIAFYKDTENGGALVKQQIVLAESNLPLYVNDPIPYGQEVTADLWYCGGKKQGSSNIDGRYAPRDGDRVEYFTEDGQYTDIRGPQTDGIKYGITNCGGTAHYKIGKSITFKMPANFQEAQADSSQELESGIISSEYIGSVLPLCSITPFTNGSVMGCVAQILYGGVFRPVAFFAQLMGQIFDFFLGYSLSDESYRHDFIQTGWQLVRDISNIFFIIIMVWSGLIAVFNTKKASYKQVIPTLIINALIINFSLFATRIVIDLSNITARIFYNQMVVKVGGEVVSGNTGFKPISEAIVSSFNPQSIFRNSVLQSEEVKKDEGESSENEGASFNSQSNVAQDNGGFKRYSKEYASYFALVTLIAIMITFSVAVMFWKTAFIFVGRVVGLYVAMIFSPFAFLSRGGLPLVSKIPSLKFDSWWGDLYKYALVAPIFVFFLYIINAFLNVEFFQKVGLDQNGQGFFGSVMYVLIPMLIIYTLVTKGVKVAENFAGDIGKMAQSFGNRTAGVVVGGALGAATGGVAIAGRNIIGRLGNRLASSQQLQDASSRGGIRGALADSVIRSGSFLSRANYDARNNTFVNSRLREFGNTNTRIGGLLGTNQTNTSGGFQGAISREVANQTSRAERMLLTGQQAAAQDSRNSAWENAYQAARNTAQQNANSQGIVFDENTYRTTYLNNQTTAGNPRPQTTAEINRQREQQNNARLARLSIVQRISNVATNRTTTPAGLSGAVTGGAGLASGAVATALAGGGIVATATIAGQGAIQNAAQQQVARQRAQNARNPLSANQINSLQNRLSQLQAELTRRISLMNNIGSSFNPPITYDNITPANIIDYQANKQIDINSRQTQIDVEQDFVDRNKNNPTMTNQVNQARSTIRTLMNEQNNLRNEIRQAGNILNEYNRINSDISGVRQQLGI